MPAAGDHLQHGFLVIRALLDCGFRPIISSIISALVVACLQPPLVPDLLIFFWFHTNQPDFQETFPFGKICEHCDWI